MRGRWSIPFALVIPVALACDGPVEPGADLIAGSYSATTFIAIVEGETLDLLPEGASFTIDLNRDGIFSGTLVIPEGLGAVGAVDTQLTGTWRFTDYALFLDGAPDTFIDDVAMPVLDDPTGKGKSLLRLSAPFGEAEIRILLQTR